jgi:hypothetical protein
LAAMKLSMRAVSAPSLGTIGVTTTTPERIGGGLKLGLRLRGDNRLFEIEGLEALRCPAHKMLRALIDEIPPQMRKAQKRPLLLERRH